MSITDNVQRILGNVAETAIQAGRDPSEITLVAVTKTRTVEEIQEACGAGVTHIGENRIQEAIMKFPQIPGGIVRHMVGHLQSNKVKIAAPMFEWIDSVDSIKLIDSISDHAGIEGKKIQVLIQVNISGEESKFGIPPEMTAELIAHTFESKSLCVRGLMTIGSLGSAPDVTRREFARMKELFDTLRGEPDSDPNFNVLSMGMSGDYRLAIKEGSTMIRIGTALFDTGNT